MADYYAAAGYVRPDFIAKTNNGLKFSKTPLDELPVTMAYVPMQKYATIYEAENALKKGTLFPDLDKPFLGKGEGR